MKPWADPQAVAYLAVRAALRHTERAREALGRTRDVSEGTRERAARAEDNLRKVTAELREQACGPVPRLRTGALRGSSGG